jgi:ABC-2 type transport system permease protein
MMRTLLTKILYQKRAFIIGWFIAMFALALFLMLMYPPLRDSDVAKLFENLSPALQKVAGDQNSFDNANNYIAQEVFALRMPLLLIIMSIILFAKLTIGEETKGLVMTQLSLPISRSRLLGTKLAAALIISVIVAIGMLAGILAGLAMIGDSVAMAELLWHVAGCTLLSLVFGLVVYLLGGGLGLKGAATGIATILAFTSYLVSSLVAIADFLEPVEKFSPFHYYQNPSPISWEHALLLGSVAIVMAVGALILFPRRDIKS